VTPRTLFDKLWDSHVIATREDGEALLWVDRHFVHEGSHHAFRQLEAKGRGVAEPSLTFGIADHYVPTRGRPAIADPDVAAMVDRLRANAKQHGIRHFDIHDPAQGIVHVVGPEQGLTLPGLLIVCGDSHTSTHGAFGAYAFGIDDADALAAETKAHADHGVWEAWPPHDGEGSCPACHRRHRHRRCGRPRAGVHR
jgi:3-isopropylmalate/(R)-2-methylmalate dehydratase large subunit